MGKIKKGLLIGIFVGMMFGLDLGGFAHAFDSLGILEGLNLSICGSDQEKKVFKIDECMQLNIPWYSDKYNVHLLAAPVSYSIEYKYIYSSNGSLIGVKLLFKYLSIPYNKEGTYCIEVNSQTCRCNDPRYYYPGCGILGSTCTNSGKASYIYFDLISKTTPIILPTVRTATVALITENSANCGGNVILDGGGTVTSRGVCWSTSKTPTISNDKTTNDSGMGSFTSNITGLDSGTTYYVRAYATNSVGTTYGIEVPFTTKSDSGTEQQESIVLTKTNPDTTISAGSIVIVYGTSGVNHVNIESGANAKLINFPGNNAITIKADSSPFMVSRSGATVTFEDFSGTILKMPATQTAQNIIFHDKTLTLVINNNQVKLGEQEVNLTPSPIL